MSKRLDIICGSSATQEHAHWCNAHFPFCGMFLGELQVVDEPTDIATSAHPKNPLALHTTLRPRHSQFKSAP
jgi:hypothetical protein